jgi:signal transduction histidine kinase
LNGTRRVIETAFERELPPELDVLSMESATLLLDLAAATSGEKRMDATTAILFKNRAGYLYSEFRDYLFRVDNDILRVLETQGARLRGLKTAMFIIISIVIAAMATVLVLLGRRGRRVVELEAALRSAIERETGARRLLERLGSELRGTLEDVLDRGRTLGEPGGRSGETEGEAAPLEARVKHALGFLADTCERAGVEGSAGGEERFEVRILVDEVREGQVWPAARKGLELTSTVAEEVPKEMVGDRTAFGLALGALVENAVRFADTGRVAIDASLSAERPGWLRIEVSSTGGGIGTEEAERLARFFAAKEPEEETDDGGDFFACRRRVRRLGGELGIASRSGGGDSFALALPLRSFAQ